MNPSIDGSSVGGARRGIDGTYADACRPQPTQVRKRRDQSRPHRGPTGAFLDAQPDRRADSNRAGALAGISFSVVRHLAQHLGTDCGPTCGRPQMAVEVRLPTTIVTVAAAPRQTRRWDRSRASPSPPSSTTRTSPQTAATRCDQAAGSDRGRSDAFIQATGASGIYVPIGTGPLDWR